MMAQTVNPLKDGSGRPQRMPAAWRWMTLLAFAATIAIYMVWKELLFQSHPESSLGSRFANVTPWLLAGTGACLAGLAWIRARTTGRWLLSGYLMLVGGRAVASAIVSWAAIKSIQLNLAEDGWMRSLGQTLPIVEGVCTVIMLGLATWTVCWVLAVAARKLRRRTAST